MKYTYFEDINNTHLPQIIIDSFEDEFEKAHLRHLDGTIYLVLNYPLHQQKRNIICITSDGKDLNMYAPHHLSNTLNHPSTLIDVFMDMVDHYEAQTKLIDDQVKAYEREMESLVQQSYITNLYNTTKDIIYIESGVRSIERVLGIIQDTKTPGFYQTEAITDYASISIETQQIIETLRMREKMITSLMQSSESLFSNKLNDSMKRLTSITFIFSVPIFITGFFGMNIHIPFQSHPYILFFILIGSIGISWWLTYVLHKNDLL